jgi:hypothetical protein
MSTDRFKQNINIKNRQAFFNYEIVDKLVAGMALRGTEIKSRRTGTRATAGTRGPSRPGLRPDQASRPGPDSPA